MIWRRRQELEARVMSRSMRSFTKKRKKSTNSLRNSTRRRPNMRKKSRMEKPLLPACLSTCRRQWLDKTSCQHRSKLRIWETTWSSSKIRWRMLRQLQQGSSSRKIKFSKIWRKWSPSRREFTMKWKTQSKSAQTWRTTWITSSQRPTNSSQTSKEKRRNSIASNNLSSSTRTV